MTCEQYQFEVSARLDSGQPAAPELIAHVDDCSACRRFAAESLALAQILPISADQDVSSDLHEQIMIAVRVTEPDQPPILWPKRFAIVAAAAAAVALVVWIRQPEAPSVAPTVAHHNVQPIPNLDLSLDMPMELTAAVQTPYARELERLSQDVAATTNFLVARLGGQEIAMRR